MRRSSLPLKVYRKFETVVLVVIVAAVLLTGVAIARAWSRARSGVPEQAQSSSTRQQGERIETELITISKTGFEPGEIRRPAGKFYLQVDNRSEMSVELRLDREGQERVETHTVDLKTLEWHEELNLEPGEYVLSSLGQPDWTCRLTITAR